MKKIVLLLSFLALAPVWLSAQRTVSGNVSDSKGAPVAGAVVMIPGKVPVAVMTTDNGDFTLQVPENAAKGQIEVSCMGYKSQTLPVPETGAVKVVLADDLELLDEVVVVGYGSMRRSDLTGSVASVRIDENDAGQSRSLDQLIQGHAAGVQVVNSSAAPDAGVNITIRGRTSLTGDSQPLYVIDGILLTTAEGAGFLSAGGDNDGLDETGNTLLGLNPQDIASIEILKDASATAIYGSEGANGVVLITTKMADKEKPRVKFSAGTDLVTLYKRMPVLSFDEYVGYLEANTANTGALSQLKKMYSGYKSPEDRGELTVTPIDWQDYSFNNALRSRYYLSVAGHPGTLSYNFSVGYNSTPGIVRTTWLEQYTFRLNAEKSIGKALKIGTKINYSLSKSQAQQGASTGGSVSTSMMRSILVSRPYRESGDDAEFEEDWEEADEDSKSTPALWLKDSYSRREQYRLTPNLYLQWQINPWLTFKLSGGGDYNMQERNRWRGASISYSTMGANVSVSDAQALRWNVDALLMFTRSKGGHSVSGTVGMTTDNRYSNTSSLVGYNIKQYWLQSDSMNSSPNAGYAYSESRRGTLSWFARAVYNYLDRYVLTGTFRVDGSSVFRGKNRFAAFPSFAFAWRVNQEPWFNVPWISSAKLRLGWGEVGNSGVRAYQTFVTYAGSRYPSHDPLNPAGYTAAMVASNLANETLKWETTRQWNAGADIGLWQGRLAVSVDAYRKMTCDLLNSKKLPYTSGYASVYVNQGAILNRGLEFTAEAVPLKFSGFELALNGNISFNRNTIIDIGTDSEGDGIYLAPGRYEKCNWYPGDMLGSGRYFYSYANIFVEGQPMGLFYGFKTDGIIQQGETGPGFSAGSYRTEGYMRYLDLDGDGYITEEDRTIIGDPNPDFTYGFGLSASYKKWSLRMNFNGSYGNDICNTNLNFLMDTGHTTLKNVLRPVVEGAWTPGDTQARYPQLGRYVANVDSSRFTDLNVEDGSYLRLSSIGLSWYLPLKSAAVKRIDLGMTAGNVCVWTKYSGWDPEVSSYGAQSKRIGIDSGSYPGTRTFCLDVKLTF